MIRCFLAVFPPAPLARSIAAACAGCAGELPRARWVAAEKLHLTLHFFGDRLPTHVEGIQARLSELSDGPSVGEVSLHKVGTFRRRTPRVVWLGLREREAGYLQELRHRFLHALAPLGEAVERRPLRPHITLARPRGRWEAHHTQMLQEALEPLRGTRFAVERVCLVASELSRAGARYRTLGECSLREVEARG